MSRLHAAVVFAGTAVGCAQVAGIQDTNGNARDGDTLAVTRMSIGTTVISTPFDLAGQRATYFVASSVGFDRVDASAGKTQGTWTTKLRAPAPVEFTLPGTPAPGPLLYDFPSSRLQVLYGVLEHPGAAAAPDGASFTVTVPLDTAFDATQGFQSYVVGAWLQRAFAAGELPTAGTTQIGPVSYSFTAGHSVSGQPKPTQVTPGDAFLVLRYVGGRLSGVAEAPPVDQTGMSTTVTMAAMAAVGQDLPLDVQLDLSKVGARFVAVRPALGALAMSWNLLAAPGYRVAFAAGPSLYSGGLVATDTGVMVKYGNPFAARGWNAMFVLGASESRVYTQPGTTLTISLIAAMNQFIEPSTGFGLSLPAGLPTVITLDGTPLTDDASIARPSKFVRVTFLTDTPGGPTTPSATLYSLQVWDLVPNQAMPPTALDRQLVLSAVGADPAFDLPPEVFQPGHSYTLRAVATLGGFPALADGNFLSRELPLAQSLADSAVITVMP